MSKKTLIALLCCASLGLTACNDDNDQDQTSPTENVTEPTLISFAKLPVETYAAGPDSGAYVKGANGIYPPFKGQPVQGFSAALKNEDAKKVYVENAALNMDKIVEHCEVMYTFLTTLDTCKIIDVNESYIEQMLKDLRG